MRQRRTVGVLAPYVGGFYFASLLDGISRSARVRDARVVAFQTTGLDLEWPTEPEALPLGWERIDGWIGIGDRIGAPYFDRIAAAGKPIVTISSRPGRRGCCAVLPDNQGGTLGAVRHLIDHGHSRIAFSGALTHTDIRERYEGYVAALHEAGLAPDPALFFPMTSMLEFDGREVGTHLVAAGLPCTAIVAGTDLNAIGILREIIRAGYRVPEDIAVVGFDDIEESRYTGPSLTTVRLRFDVLGGRAADVLFARIFDGAVLPDIVRVRSSLVIRASCGCRQPAASLPELQRGAPPSGSPQTSAFSKALLDTLRATEAAGFELTEDMALAATRIAAALFSEEVVTLDGAVEGHLDVSRAWQDLLRFNDDAETIEAVLLLIDSAAPEGPLAAEDATRNRATAARHRVRLDLIRAIRALGGTGSPTGSRAEDNRKIDRALIGADFTTLQELAWLRWGRVRHAALGIWTAPTPTRTRRLCIRNVFPPLQTPASLIGSEHSADQFPPPDLLELLDNCTGEILSVVPITGGGSNRGLLCVVGPVESDAPDSTGNLAQWAALLSAAMDRDELLGSLRQNAFHDALTGLPNRALLMDRLEQAIARSQRTRTRFAVLFLDLDRFKTINDSLGHIAGDHLLVQIAERLSDRLRATDTIARLGGDEFAIVVTDIADEEAAALVADRLQDALRDPFEIGTHRVFTSASVGITMSAEKLQRAEDFLRDADTAMYRAKSQGRAHHQLFDGHMHSQAMERLSLEAGLRRALERDEFVLHYQPLVSLGSGQIVGVEALIRWRHPDLGFLPPATFLPVAEESGLILAMSAWVMRAACDRASQFCRELHEPMRVSINVPPQQLKDPRFVDQVRDNLRRTGISPASLGLELLESSLVETSATIIDNLQELRAMGIYIAIDDFGTGYSSLSYLKRLPIDALKIDRSFTSGIPSDANDMAISTTIIAMAQSLKLNVVAEGVETSEQADFLRGHGCAVAQGYFFSPPLSGEDCLSFFKEPRRPGHSARLEVSSVPV